MTPSKTCKLAGIKGTRALAKSEGVHPATIAKWFRNDRELFDAALQRAVDKMSKTNENDTINNIRGQR